MTKTKRPTTADRVLEVERARVRVSEVERKLDLMRLEVANFRAQRDERERERDVAVKDHSRMTVEVERLTQDAAFSETCSARAASRADSLQRIVNSLFAVIAELRSERHGTF